MFLLHITLSYFNVPKEVRLNSTHLFIMKIPNKRGLHQIAIIHSSSNDFIEFMKIFKEYITESYSFVVDDSTLISVNALCLRKNILEKVYHKIMTIDDQIKDEKLQYNINRKATKILALSSGKTDKWIIKSKYGKNRYQNKSEENK